MWKVPTSTFQFAAPSAKNPKLDSVNFFHPSFFGTMFLAPFVVGSGPGRLFFNQLLGWNKQNIILEPSHCPCFRSLDLLLEGVFNSFQQDELAGFSRESGTDLFDIYPALYVRTTSWLSVPGISDIHTNYARYVACFGILAYLLGRGRFVA